MFSFSLHFSACTSLHFSFFRLFHRMKYITVSTSGITAFQFIVERGKRTFFSCSIWISQRKTQVQDLANMSAPDQSLWPESFCIIIGQIRPCGQPGFWKQGKGISFLWLAAIINLMFSTWKEWFPKEMWGGGPIINKGSKVFRNINNNHHAH